MGLLVGGGIWRVFAEKIWGRKVEKARWVEEHHLWCPTAGEKLQVREGGRGTWKEDSIWASGAGL